MITNPDGQKDVEKQIPTTNKVIGPADSIKKKMVIIAVVGVIIVSISIIGLLNYNHEGANGTPKEAFYTWTKNINDSNYFGIVNSSIVKFYNETNYGLVAKLNSESSSCTRPVL